MTERMLIVNADDLGLSVAVNLGIARGHEHGVVTRRACRSRCGCRTGGRILTIASRAVGWSARRSGGVVVP